MKHNIAIVGCGGVSDMHFEGCARHADRVEIVAACDPDVERRARAQSKYGVGQGFASVGEMIEGASWDAAIVCTPTHLRESVVAELAAAGKHVFVEKPMASSLKEGVRLVEICRASSVQMAVDQNFRYHFPFYLAREQIAAGLVGRVTTIHLQHLCFRQDVGWRTREKRHVLEVMGVHWLDGFRWILGSDGATVAAQMRYSDAIGCVGETDLTVQVGFENGVSASYADSFSSRISRAEAIIIGEAGTLRLDYNGMTFFDGTTGAQPTRPWGNPYAGNGKPDSAFACLDGLLRAIESGDAADNSGADNLKTLNLMEAAYRSAETGATVTLKEGLL